MGLLIGSTFRLVAFLTPKTQPDAQTGSDVPDMTPAKAGTQFIDPGVMKDRVELSRSKRISCSRIFSNDQCASGLEPGRLKPVDYDSNELPTVPRQLYPNSLPCGACHFCIEIMAKQ